MNSLKRELITLCNLKSLWIVSVIVIIVCGWFLHQNYSTANVNINFLLEDYDITNNESYEPEYIQELQQEIETIYATFAVKNFLNNAYGILIGIGMLVFPIVGIILIADDYSKGVIKNKIVYHGLTSVIFSKIVAIFIYLVVFLATYSFLQYIEAKVLYDKCLANLDLKGLVRIDNMKIEKTNDIPILLVTFFLLFFYVALCMLLTFLGKNMVFGFAMLIINNYAVLPIKYTPHHIFYWLIYKVFKMTDYSPFNFANTVAFQNSSIPLGILGGYFIIMMAVFFAISKLQKN